MLVEVRLTWCAFVAALLLYSSMLVCGHRNFGEGEERKVREKFDKKKNDSSTRSRRYGERRRKTSDFKVYFSQVNFSILGTLIIPTNQYVYK